MTPELNALLAVVSSFAVGAAASWLYGYADERRLRREIECHKAKNDELQELLREYNDELARAVDRARRNEWEM